MNKRPSARKVKAENRKRVLAAYEDGRRTHVSYTDGSKDKDLKYVELAILFGRDPNSATDVFQLDDWYDLVTTVADLKEGK